MSSLINIFQYPVRPVLDELLKDRTTGDVEVPQEKVVGTAADIFGDKVFGDKEQRQVEKQFKAALEDKDNKTEDDERSAFDNFKNNFRKGTVESIVSIAKEKYQESIRKSDERSLNALLSSKFNNDAEKAYENYKIGPCLPSLYDLGNQYSQCLGPYQDHCCPWGNPGPGCRPGANYRWHSHPIFGLAMDLSR